MDGLPGTVPALCQIIQGLLIHILEARRYGVELPEERKQEVQIGHVAGILARSLELDASPLSVARPPQKRVVATCHDFAHLLCAMLRRQGVAARARAGFAAYLVPGKYIDHWACQYWQPEQRRWVMVDAQLDEVHRQAYAIAFDPCDVPAEQYLTAGAAWQLCRTGKMDANLFGFSRWWGLGYLRHSLLRDLLALNKQELLPWNSAGLPEREEAAVSDEERAVLDEIAALSLDSNEAFPALRSAYQRVARLGSPPDWRPWLLEQV